MWIFARGGDLHARKLVRGSMRVSTELHVACDLSQVAVNGLLLLVLQVWINVLRGASDSSLRPLSDNDHLIIRRCSRDLAHGLWRGKISIEVHCCHCWRG